MDRHLIGINGGYGWATSNETTTVGTTSGDYSQTGGLAGVTYGGNWSSSSILRVNSSVGALYFKRPEIFFIVFAAWLSWRSCFRSRSRSIL